MFQAPNREREPPNGAGETSGSRPDAINAATASRNAARAAVERFAGALMRPMVPPVGTETPPNSSETGWGAVAVTASRRSYPGSRWSPRNQRGTTLNGRNQQADYNHMDSETCPVCAFPLNRRTGRCHIAAHNPAAPPTPPPPNPLTDFFIEQAGRRQADGGLGLSGRLRRGYRDWRYKR